MTRRLALALAACLPLAAVAQTPPAPAADPAPAAAPAAPALTIDLGGWAQWNAFETWGGANANDLIRTAGPQRSERTFGMSVRQSRFRANLGLPSDGLLGGAKLKGLVEMDFVGGYANGDESLPIARLRHYWVSATWKDLGNLSLLVGQTWGIFEGPYFAASLAHLAVPRFAGAGFLFRRAPQVRVSGDMGDELNLAFQAALMAPMDRNIAAAGTANLSVGERSGLPDVEARVAATYRPNRKNMLEVALSAHAGRETYALTGTAGAPNGSVDSWGGAVDFKLDIPMLTVLCAGFAGKNLDVLNTAGNGVTIGTGGTPVGPVSVTGVTTKGAWVQAQVTLVPGLQLLGGGGIEAPERKDLPATGVVWRNGQLSGGAVFNLTSKWKASAEYTHYVTRYVEPTNNRYVANQLEIGTLYAF
jgi:hypothetical protein